MKILVVKRDKLGDLLLATPMVRHLRDRLPDAQIHLLANDYNAWVVERNEDIDRLWVSRRVRHAGRVSISAAFRNLAQTVDLRRQRFDWVLVANGDESLRAISKGLSAGGGRCVAYCNDASRFKRLTDPLPVRHDLHEMDRMLMMLAPLGVSPPDADLLPSYLLPGSSASFAREWLSSRGLEPGGYVVLGLGARRPKKQPSTEQVLTWSLYLTQVHGLQTVFMWTPGAANDPLYPGDDEIAQPVLDRGLAHIHPFRGPIGEALGLIWSARTSLFPDSGLMHFAAASPGGVLGFFAETSISPSPVQWGPRGLKADYLEASASVSELADALVLERLEALLG